MHYVSILDSASALNNYKTRNGLRITGQSSVSLYSAQTKLTKLLSVGLDSFFKYTSERDQVIYRIIDRCEDLETIEAIKSYYNDVKPEQFLELAKGKIRPFFKTVKNYIS